MDLMSGPELMDHLLQVGVYTENDVKVGCPVAESSVSIFARAKGYIQTRISALFFNFQVIMGHLFDAVSHMHSHNIVHRDLKLENLVLRKPDDLSTVAIVDFGLAKVS